MAMTVRPSDQSARRLRERAEADLDGRSRAEIVDAALADTLAHYGTTLKRLGN
jgi:predicted transcriptional regulator